ncbi:hemolysin family protein [Undibacterium fentianense]|uniref:HlyC/CorC family transporter n=1 Tax=Undibacterium fentianense TaxID=2828728 RepID=A0A941DYW8_9BURK|nr:hemolysin family protein [Undibacterium fentianense]MBR7799330.1 HlyC/CorC family transporter [Undibacterium fentianense]
MDILIILGLILVNGLFAMSEIAVVSSKRIRLQKLSESGSRGAQVALELSDSPSRFLSTIQVGITLIGIFNGAFGEASLVAQLTPKLETLPLIAEFAREVALGIVVVCITFSSLILGELLPKRIAMQYPETVASLIAMPMQYLSKVMGPFVKVLTITTEALLRLIGLHQAKNVAVTEEEIAGMLQEGTDAGLFEKTEHEIVSRALRLDDIRVVSLMTPRMDIDFIDIEKPLEDNLAKIASSPYSRFPVCKGDLSNVIGIIHGGHLFDQAIERKSMQSLDIVAAIKPPLFIPEALSAMQLLESFKKNRAELALIINEYGEIEGIVTLSDVLGALVGDVVAVDHQDEQDCVQREDGSWLVDGGVSFDRFREILDSEVRFPEETLGSYHTLAGFVLTHFGYIPRVSEHFEWEGFRIEVVDMDKNRIDRLLISEK